MSANNAEAPKRSLLIPLSIVLGAMAVALASGTVNNVNTLTTMIQTDRGYDQWAISTIQTIGLFMLYFTFFAGMILDRFGPVIAISLGAAVSCSGYFIMFAASFLASDNATLVLLILGYGLVGLGSGSTFVASMGTSMKAIPTNPGLAISMPGLMMSLSMAATQAVESAYTSRVDCDNDSCWGYMILVLVCTMIVVYGFGILLIAIGSKLSGNAAQQKAVQIQESSAAVVVVAEEEDVALTEGSTLLVKEEEEKELDGGEVLISFLQAINILFILLFWAVTFGYFVGVGIGLIVVTQMTQLWENFACNGDCSVSGNDWSSTISILFSVANALSNVVAGAASDFLSNKGIMTRKVFVSCYLAACCLLMMALALMNLGQSDNTGLQVLYAALMVSVGFAWGTSFTMFPAITGEFFGHLNFGLYFSFVQVGPLAASLVVPYLCSGVYKVTDHYTLVFVIFAVAALLSAIFLLVVKQRRVPLMPPACAAPVLRHPTLVAFFEKKQM